MLVVVLKVEFGSGVGSESCKDVLEVEVRRGDGSGGWQRCWK